MNTSEQRKEQEQQKKRDRRSGNEPLAVTITNPYFISTVLSDDSHCGSADNNGSCDSGGES